MLHLLVLPCPSYGLQVERPTHVVTHLVVVVEVYWKSKTERIMQAHYVPELGPEYEPLLHHMFDPNWLVETPKPCEDYEHLSGNQVGPNTDVVVRTWEGEYQTTNSDLTGSSDY